MENLYRFIAIYETGSITKAAKKINLTQPALSLSLKRLEKELKVKLIIRNNKNFSVTEDGKSAYFMAKKIIQIWEGIKNPKKRLDRKKTYTVGLFDNAAITLSRNPQFLSGKDYITEVIIDNSTNLQKFLSKDLLDVCIYVLDLKNSETGDARLIGQYEEELIPVSSGKFSLPLFKIPFILYNNSSHTRSFVDNTFLKNKIEPNILATSTSTTFLKELAILGKGVALLPKTAVIEELKNKRLIKQKFPIVWKRKVGIYLSQNSQLTKDSSFVKMIVKTLCFAAKS